MPPDKTRPIRLDFFTMAALCLLCLAGCLRFTSLGNLPGVNADEADMGVRILEMLHHQPYSLVSHTGQYFDPIFVLSEACLFKCYPQSFYLLRLPAVVCAGLGIVILIYGYERIFRDWPGALLLGAFTACLPTHLMFSRLGWDPTFLLFWTPILLYLFLRLLDSPRPIHFYLLAISIPVSIWTHMTAAIFDLALLIALFWVRRQAAAGWLQNRLPKFYAHRLPRNGTLLFVLCLIPPALFAWMCWYALHRSVPAIADAAPNMAWRVLIFPGFLPLHLRLLGDTLTGYRALAYFVGQPDSTTFKLIAWCAELVLLGGWLRMARSINLFDRFLAALLFVYFALILLTAGFLHVYLAGNLRYVIPLMVLLPVVVIRMVPWPIVILPCCAVMLATYWTHFVRPALEDRYAGATELTLWTGPREPKAEAAQLILQLAEQSPHSGKPTVYTDMYWMAKPLEFLVFDRAAVRQVDSGWNPLEAQPGDFIAGYAGDNFEYNAADQLASTGRHLHIYNINNPAGLPQVIVAQMLP